MLKMRIRFRGLQKMGIKLDPDLNTEKTSYLKYQRQTHIVMGKFDESKCY